MAFYQRVSAAALAIALAGAAQAAPVKWVVEGFLLDDGGEVTGSYIYDAATDAFSEVMLSVSAGSVLGAADFIFSGNFAAAGIVDTYVSFPADLTGVRSLYFELAADMTDAGGTIAILGFDSPNFGRNIVDGFCEDSICEFYDADQAGRGPMVDSSPRVVGTPVPVVPLPAGAVLLVTGLAAFSAFRRRRGSS